MSKEMIEEEIVEEVMEIEHPTKGWTGNPCKVLQDILQNPNDKMYQKPEPVLNIINSLNQGQVNSNFAPQNGSLTFLAMAVRTLDNKLQTEVVEALLEKGATNLNSLFHEFTPLEYLLQRKPAEMEVSTAIALIKKGATLSNQFIPNTDAKVNMQKVLEQLLNKDLNDTEFNTAVTLIKHGAKVSDKFVLDNNTREKIENLNDELLSNPNISKVFASKELGENFKFTLLSEIESLGELLEIQNSLNEVVQEIGRHEELSLNNLIS